MEDASLHFRQFATTLEQLIARKYGLPEYTERTVTEVQRGQVERLATLEEEFRLALVRHSQGPKVYQEFVTHICDERRNILAARPYFRERQTKFTSHISTAMKKRAWRSLLGFHINYQFIAFALRAVAWRPASKVVLLARKIEKIRTELVELNLPLAISRSRIFWSRTPKSHLSFMDFIQIATEGLLAAVDKYVGPYSTNFRNVAIGRMVGNFIESYSATHLHFFPSDRRKIYRANKFMSKHPHGGVDYDDLANYVNQSRGNGQETNAAEISNLVSAASTVSTDTHAPNETEVADNLSRYEAPEESRPDVQVEQGEALRAVYLAASKLSLFERKLLRLRGIEVPLDTAGAIG